MQQFNVVIKNEKIPSYRFITLLLVVFNIAIFAFLAFSQKYFYTAIVSLVVLVAYILFRWWQSKNKREKFYVQVFIFFVMTLSWVLLHNYIIASLCLFTGTLYYFSLQKPEFIFNEEGIRRINFPKAFYQWNTLSNVIIKDNMLTIDFINNRLLQAEVENNINENTFNLFARSLLNIPSK